MSDDQARGYFDEQSDPPIDPFDHDDEPRKKEKKHKKKNKKDKKKNKKKREYADEDDLEEQSEVNSMFDQYAESDDEADEDQISGGEIDYEQRQRYQELFNKRRAADEYYEKIVNKNEKQLTEQFRRQASKRRETQEMYPGKGDPKLYWVSVRPNHEDEMVLCILNKAKHLSKTQNKVTIVSAMSMKKKYPGRILVQAYNERDIRDSLDGFNNVNLGKKIVQLQIENYTQLFNKKLQNKYDFKLGEFVRVGKGLYENDLAKIEKINKNYVVVTAVPRINIQDLELRMREEASKLNDEEKIKEKKHQILKLLTNHRANYYKERPHKTPLTPKSFECLECESVSKLIKIDTFGNISLKYKIDEIRKVQGTYLPVQVLPFTNGRLIESVEQDRRLFTTTINFKKGEEVQIVAGQLVKHYGTIIEIKENIGVIKCKNKQLLGELLEEPLEHLAKRFKKGQRVKVISGADSGKTGLILEVEQRLVEILTDNNNTIKINKNNLELYHGQVICEENVHGLKKDDLIKTSKNLVGIVIETQKDSIKILDSNNTIQIISNMDFDSTVSTKNIIAKNRTGEQITSNSSIRIRQGIHEGKRCVVKHVYRQFIFLFNSTFDRTAGITVQSADNCSLISKNDTVKKPMMKNTTTSNNTNESDEIAIGKTITLKTGPFKGYQGIIKSINKDKIEVRVPSKSVTEWVPRQNISSNQSNMQIGRTPNRRGGPSVTHMYAASPVTKY